MRQLIDSISKETSSARRLGIAAAILFTALAVLAVPRAISAQVELAQASNKHAELEKRLQAAKSIQTNPQILRAGESDTSQATRKVAEVIATAARENNVFLARLTTSSTTTPVDTGSNNPNEDDQTEWFAAEIEATFQGDAPDLYRTLAQMTAADRPVAIQSVRMETTQGPAQAKGPTTAAVRLHVFARAN